MRGNYDLAAQGFREYLGAGRNTDLSDNALYWIGECYDAQEETRRPSTSSRRCWRQYPTSDKAAAAQLKKGLLYLKLGDQGQGVVNLQYVVYEHPGTNEADLARERLRSLGLTIDSHARIESIRLTAIAAWLNGRRACDALKETSQMATIKGTKKQARKRHRQSLERRMRNQSVRTRVRRQMRADARRHRRGRRRAGEGAAAARPCR